MITNKFFLLILVFVISGCATPSFLPDPDYVDCNEYGAYIKVRYNSYNSPVKGELIAAEKDTIVVLINSSNNMTDSCIKIPFKKTYGYTLRYARPKHYGWTIPVFTIATLAHGYFAVITMPVNLITTIIVTISGERSYKLTDYDIKFEKLKIYARFPQGIPPGVELSAIR